MIHFQYHGQLSERLLKIIDKVDTKPFTNDFTVNLNANKEEQIGLIINPKEAMKIVTDKENLIRILRLNKIRCPRIIEPGKKTTFPIIGRKFEHKNGTDIRLIDNLDECATKEDDYYQAYINFKREYIVHVCNLKIIKIEEKYRENERESEDLIIRTKSFGYKTKEISLSDFTSQKREQLSLMATRALAVTGLDMGYLNIGQTEDELFYVIDIDFDLTRLDEETFYDYIQETLNMLHEYERVYQYGNDVTIGCDPELLLKDINNNTLIPASLLLQNNEHLGLDDRTIEASKQFYPILEIRPEPSKDPLEVYASIKAILNDLGKIAHYENIGIFSGSAPVMDYWLGGHIHFGYKPNPKLLRALDHYLALPMMFIANTKTLRQRYKFYGYLSFFRPKIHGGFEYCTLSSWLVDKKIIKGVLSLAKLISTEYLHLQSSYLNNYLDYKSYYSVKKDYFREIINDIIAEIKTTSSYATYKEHIKYLFEMIKNDKEWNENVDLKEIFNLPKSSETYHLDHIIYIPKKKRDALNLKVHDEINLYFGRKKYRLNVLPRDDFSANNDGYVSFSSDIYRKLNLENGFTFDIFKTGENTFKCGPIFGIHCDKNYHRLGPFGKQSLYFKRIIKLARKRGILAYIFSLDDIDYKNHSVTGMTYDFAADNWYQSTFPLPDILYDRGFNIVEEIYGKDATIFRQYFKDHQLKAINSFRTINTVSDKLACYELLVEDRRTAQYLPETHTFSEKNLKSMINKYDLLYCKLINGSLGSLIYSIQKTGNDEYIIIHRDKYDERVKVRSTYHDLYANIKSLMKVDGQAEYNYIVQEGLKFVEYHDRPYELRILMVKNHKGIWTRLAMVGRVRLDNQFLGRVDSEKRSSSLLKKTLGKNEPFVREQIYALIDDVLAVLQERKLEAGELAIDIGITKDYKVYIIEINSKPDTLLSYIGAFNLRNLYINRILDYSKYLLNK